MKRPGTGRAQARSDSHRARLGSTVRVPTTTIAVILISATKKLQVSAPSNNSLSELGAAKSGD
eukprot:767934-Hanusia_phi.AAC.6